MYTLYFYIRNTHIYMFVYVKYFNMMELDDYVMYYIFKRYGEYLLLNL